MDLDVGLREKGRGQHSSEFAGHTGDGDFGGVGHGAINVETGNARVVSEQEETRMDFSVAGNAGAAQSEEIYANVSFISSALPYFFALSVSKSTSILIHDEETATISPLIIARYVSRSKL